MASGPLPSASSPTDSIGSSSASASGPDRLEAPNGRAGQDATGPVAGEERHQSLRLGSSPWRQGAFQVVSRLGAPSPGACMADDEERHGSDAPTRPSPMADPGHLHRLGRRAQAPAPATAMPGSVGSGKTSSTPP